MNPIKRTYDIIVESPDMVETLDKALHAHMSYTSDRYGFFVSDNEKEQIKAERFEVYKEYHKELIDKIRSMYPEFCDDNHKLVNFGRKNGIRYITIERKITFLVD